MAHPLLRKTRTRDDKVIIPNWAGNRHDARHAALIEASGLSQPSH
jgi:hypothetical protein